MRRPVDSGRLDEFLRELGVRAAKPTRVYLTGGATAVAFGWRKSTIDVDVKFEPESDEILRAVPELKEKLAINVELASPELFIPELPGWRERAIPIGTHGKLSAYHYDPYAQALAKIERGHARDRGDVARMMQDGLVEPARLKALFEEIAPRLYRYPAIDPESFRRRLEEALGSSAR